MQTVKYEKIFSTAGPVNRPNLYKIDPLTRWDLQDVLSLIRNERYFLLHAPRQTGKTSCLAALVTYLNNEGSYYAVYTSFEVGVVAGDDYLSGITIIVQALLSNVGKTLKDKFDEKAARLYFNEVGPANGLQEILKYLAETLDKPLVLLIDEIDGLVGKTLMTVLRQLRTGYIDRPKHFPHSILLCGLRSIKDFRLYSMDEIVPAGNSSFNILAKVLRLGNFTRDEVANLYQQHTEETGQRFEDGVFDTVMEYTDGQPWLVNAIANEVTNEMRENRDRSVFITKDMIEVAKEHIILARLSHLDCLMDKLNEARVRRVILPMLTGELGKTQPDDVSYCMDLGLIKKVNGGLCMANKIYKEVIPRELTQDLQELFPNEIPSLWKNPNGTVNVNNFLTLFKDYWYENMAIWGSDMAGYKEACAQLVTLTYLQKVINGGGEINREYAAGTKKMDIYIKRPYYTGSGSRKKLRNQKIVLELKTITDEQNYDTVIQKALKQTAEYAKIVGVKEAEILIFNRGATQRWGAGDPVEPAEYDKVRLQIWKL